MLTREQPIVGHDSDARTVTVQLCRWNDPRDVTDPDGARYREQFPPGSLELAADVHVANRHQGAIVGRADPATYADGGDGPTVDIVVARTRDGLDAMELVDAGVVRSVSMEFEPVAHKNTGGVITRTKSVVHGLAFAFRPAHDAPILAVREREPNMITDTPTLEPADVDTAPAVGELVTGEVLSRELDVLRRDMIADQRGDGGHPLARFRSFDEYLQAAYSDTDVRDRAGGKVTATSELLTRALADQITTNNPGVIPPGWVSKIYGVVEQGRPTISAFGVEDPGPVGMDVNWPYFDGDLKLLVGKQATQKTAITSVRVDLKKGTKALETIAGGSDISYQLIRRSSPSYRDAYMQIMFAGYAAVTDQIAAVALIGGQGITYDVTADATGAALRSALFVASIKVQTATGRPASFALAATDVFVKIGGMTTIYPAPYGTNNTTGTADAGTLAVNVSGIPVIHDPYLTAGDLFVSNESAASWYEDGPFTVVAEDPEKLGQNVAIWGLGAFAVHVPLGVVQLNATGTPVLLEAREAAVEAEAAEAEAAEADKASKSKK